MIYSFYINLEIIAKLGFFEQRRGTNGYENNKIYRDGNVFNDFYRLLGKAAIGVQQRDHFCLAGDDDKYKGGRIQHSQCRCAKHQ